MSKYYTLPFLLVLALVSCNPVGDEIIEIPLKLGEVSSAEQIDLKKGDQVVIWSKLELNDKDESPDFKVKYNIENEGKSILFDSLNVFSGPHTINSKKTKESYQSSATDESTGNVKDSTVYYTDHTFELENTQFIVPKDGKYNFDFKLTKDLSSFSKGFSIVLRKTSN